MGKEIDWGTVLKTIDAMHLPTEKKDWTKEQQKKVEELISAGNAWQKKYDMASAREMGMSLPEYNKMMGIPEYE